MEFNSEIAAFQGALLSADNIHNFTTITSKGGNEEKTDYVIQTLKRFLKAEKYIDESGLVNAKIPSTRKFTMYIILNADLEILDELMNISEIEPLIWSIPTVPKYLMCEIIWQLHLEPFIYEVIPKCWPQLGLEVAQAFLENFKYLNPTDCLDKLGKLSASCYALLCRINCLKLEDKLLCTLTAVFETLQKFLKYYTKPPNKHKLDALSTDDLYKYKGKRFINILNLVHDCASMFTKDASPLLDDPIYRVTYSAEYLQNIESKVCESPCELVLEYVNNSNKFLLEILQEVFMDLTLDIFCAWSEFDDNGKSMQQTVGEWCDKVHTKLQSISSLSQHPVLTMILMMSRKPTNVNELVNTVDINTLLECIHDGSAESQLWIRALVYKENLLEHTELVHVVMDNLSVYNDKDSFKLYNKFNMATIDSSNKELLLPIKIKLFHKCNVLDKHDILKEQFKDKIFRNSMITDDFEVQLNVMFNKFISDIDVDYTDILTLFYQYPRKVYVKIFGYATQNVLLMEPMLKLLALLKDYTEYCYNADTEPCMIALMKYLVNQCLHPIYNCNIVRFFSSLKKLEFVSNSQLLMLVVMPSIHEALMAKDINRMHIQVKLLTAAYTVNELLPYRAPMLVVMGQMMEIIRFKRIEKFRMNALKALETVIQFQKSIIDTYRQVIPDNDGSWLREKLRNLKMNPLNFYYFKSLWNMNGKSFFEFVTGCRIHKGVRLNVLSLPLTQYLLPYSTLDEWCIFWDNFIDGEIPALDVLRMYHSAVDVFTKKIVKNRTSNKVACLLNCYGNLVHIIRYKYLREPLTDFQVTSCCILLAHNLKSTHDSDIMDLEIVIMPLFAYLAERKNDYRANVPQFFVNTNFLYTAHKFFPSVNGEELT